MQNKLFMYYSPILVTSQDIVSMHKIPGQTNIWIASRSIPGIALFPHETPWDTLLNKGVEDLIKNIQHIKNKWDRKVEKHLTFME